MLASISAKPTVTYSASDVSGVNSISASVDGTTTISSGAAINMYTLKAGAHTVVVKATDPTVENFLAGGLVPIGRSTTPEFGMTFDTVTNYLNSVRVTRNPWNLQRTAGGSSGGSGPARWQIERRGKARSPGPRDRGAFLRRAA